MDEVIFGLLQVSVIILDNPSFDGQICREFESVMNRGMIRLIDLLFMEKQRWNPTSISVMQEGHLSSRE